jgi:hypothetical protein
MLRFEIDVAGLFQKLLRENFLAVPGIGPCCRGQFHSGGIKLCCMRCFSVACAAIRVPNAFG